MAQFLFYTYEGITIAPDGEFVENCQLLGRANGNNQQGALANLLNENPWITARGFDPKRIISQELPPSIAFINSSW